VFIPGLQKTKARKAKSVPTTEGRTQAEKEPDLDELAAKAGIP
jgi:hypothetical protein